MDRRNFIEHSFVVTAASACSSLFPFLISSEKVFRAGWQTRAFEETGLDCLATFRMQGENLDWTDYLSAEKEKQVLDAWERQRHG